MVWHDKIQDMAVLHSLIDDLELFWQLKANRWEGVERRLKTMLEEAKEYQEGEKLDLNTKLARTLKGDEDYVDVKLRIKEEVADTKKLCKFLGIDTPKEIKALNFKPPLMDNARIEEAIAIVEETLVPLCRVSSYSYHWMLQFFRQPRQFIKECWEFYYGS